VTTTRQNEVQYSKILAVLRIYVYIVAVTGSTDVFMQLSDNLRLSLLRLLDEAGEALCVAEIVDILQKPQYAVSRGLRHLLRAGLVEEFRQGRLVYYDIRRDSRWRALEAAVRFGLDGDSRWAVVLDRLRWRKEIRRDGKCVITYPRRQENGEYDSNGTGARRLVRKRGVLFVCVHNSARSQMAEAYLRQLGGDLFTAESAGLEPGSLNPYVVEVLKEEGIDISGKVTRDVFDVYRSGGTYSYVITVCSREAEEKCPVFPGPGHRLSWPFEDPSGFTGTDEEIIERTRVLRDRIKEKIFDFIKEYRHGQDRTGEIFL
jgi:arsenate reductase (thioredoxin)